MTTTIVVPEVRIGAAVYRDVPARVWFDRDVGMAVDSVDTAGIPNYDTGCVRDAIENMADCGELEGLL